MKIVILQSNYLPWRGYFDLIHDADVFVFYDNVQYTKNDWRNRNRLCSKNGLFWLSIPIEKSATKLLIDQVKLPDTNWHEKHWNSLTSTYGKAPFWQDLNLLLRPFYENPGDSLVSLNRGLIQAIAKSLGIKTIFKDVRDLNIDGDRVSRLVNVVSALGGQTYLTGPSAMSYLVGSEHLFSEKGIQLEVKSYPGYPSYPQWVSPFQPSVSIVDLIAHVGLGRAPSFIWDNLESGNGDA